MKGEHTGSKDKNQNSWGLGVMLCPFFFVLLYSSSLPECFFLIVMFIIYVSMETVSLCQGAIPVCLLLRGCKTMIFLLECFLH